MREVAKFERVSKRDLRRMSRRERRAYKLEMAQAERQAAQPRSRLLPTNHYVQTAYAESEEETQKLEAATIPQEAPPAPMPMVQPSKPLPRFPVPYEFSAIEWKAAGNLSFNPRPRYVARFEWSPDAR